MPTVLATPVVCACVCVCLRTCAVMCKLLTTSSIGKEKCETQVANLTDLGSSRKQRKIPIDKEQQQVKWLRGRERDKQEAIPGNHLTLEITIQLLKP